MLGPHAEDDLALDARHRQVDPGPAQAPIASHDAREAHRRAPDEAGHEHVRGALVELARRADLLEPAAVHHRDAIAHCHRLDLVVRDVDGGGADLLLQALDLAARLHAQLRVEVGQRLVHEEDARIAYERPAQRHPLLLAARELARLALEQLAELERAGGA